MPTTALMRSPAGWGIAFFIASILSTNALVVSRGPYLQKGTSTNVVVRWRTDLPSDSRVRFGTNVALLDFTASDAFLTNEHEVGVNGLTPDTKYFYSVGTSTNVLAGGDTNYFFTTAPLPGTVKSTRIWVIGDSGTKNDNARNVRDAYYNHTGSQHTDVWLTLGDNAYNDGTDTEYQAGFFDMYPSLLRKCVVWPALGNHDTANSTVEHTNYPYYSIFTLPANGEAGGVTSGTEQYYSFNYANIHFICLDSVTASRATNGPMANWLRADLAANTNTWTIAYWHHAPYSRGSHDGDGPELEMAQMRTNMLPILEKGGVDLVLTGHSHSYERSYLINGFYDYSWNLTNSMKLNTNSGQTSATGPYIKSPEFIGNQGTVYAVVGSSGQASGGSLNLPFMISSLNQLGSLVVDINGNQLDASFIRTNGTIPDSFTMVKQHLRFDNPRILSNGQFQATLTQVAAGKTNVMQTGTNLVTWIPISTNVISSNSFPFTDLLATNYSSRFYRVLRLP